MFCTVPLTDGHLSMRPIISIGRFAPLRVMLTSPSPSPAPIAGPGPAVKAAIFMESRPDSVCSSEFRRGLRSPLVAEHLLCRNDIGAIFRYQKVAICPMFNSVAPRIAPIVEHLAAEQVPTDAPNRLVILRLQEFVADHEVVEVEHFECRVVKHGLAVRGFAQRN